MGGYPVKRPAGQGTGPAAPTFSCGTRANCQVLLPTDLLYCVSSSNVLSMEKQVARSQQAECWVQLLACIVRAFVVAFNAESTPRVQAGRTLIVRRAHTLQHFNLDP